MFGILYGFVYSIVTAPFPSSPLASRRGKKSKEKIRRKIYRHIKLFWKFFLLLLPEAIDFHCTRDERDIVKTLLTSLLSSFLYSPVSRAEILGNSEVFIKSGNDINLTCVALEAPAPPLFIYWYKAGSVINYSQRGGISVLTERNTKTSKLLISRAMSSDSGNYTCSPSNSGERKTF